MHLPQQTRPSASGARVNTYGQGTRDVVLIHGLAGLFNSWQYNIPELSRHYRVHEILLPDYRDAEQGFELGEFTDCVVAALRERRLQRTALIGHSTGGLIAALVAAMPEVDISTLVLVASSGLQTDTSSMKRILRRPPSRENLPAVLETIFHDPDPFTAELIEMADAQFDDRAWFRGLLRTARKVRPHSLECVLPTIDIPTLVVWGNEDQVLSVDLAEEFRCRLRRARLEIFPACGHAPQIEHPARFNRLVVELLGAA